MDPHDLEMIRQASHGDPKDTVLVTRRLLGAVADALNAPKHFDRVLDLAPKCADFDRD